MDQGYELIPLPNKVTSWISLRQGKRLPQSELDQRSELSNLSKIGRLVLFRCPHSVFPGTIVATVFAYFHASYASNIGCEIVSGIVVSVTLVDCFAKRTVKLFGTIHRRAGGECFGDFSQCGSKFAGAVQIRMFSQAIDKAGRFLHLANLLA